MSEAKEINVNKPNSDCENDDSSGDENFVDATDKISISSEMDLESSIKDVHIALNLFLNNKFGESKARLEPWADKSIYHSLGYSTIMYLQAIMTMSPEDIDNGIKHMKSSVKLCNYHRKKHSIANVITKTNYDSFTDVEIHAELCYAECLIERAMLSFLQDENLISFVKGSLKIRAGYQSYKECFKILQNRNWKNDSERLHFESGVRMGIGLFNLMISLLPTKILKLLEFVGFSGNKHRGMTELERGAAIRNSLRGPLCSLALLSYHTVITYVLGTADGNIVLADELIKSSMKYYPKGAMFLFFLGRIQFIKGNVTKAIDNYDECIEAQDEWKQFHHMCYWELMWCHSYNGDWLLAMKYAERLCHESRWSPATYTYQKASFLIMCPDPTEETHSHLNYLFNQIPKLKQKIAGKSIPIEKFAIKKAQRYRDQENRLTLPAYELFYVWNGFAIIGKNEELIAPILRIVEDTINEIIQNKDSYKHFYDDYCLALLLKGVCLQCKNQDFQADQCFKEICLNENKIKEDLYLIPYTTMEMGLLKIKQKSFDEAKVLLEKAKTNYKGYSLESRLHFRVHAAMLQIKAIKEPELYTTENDDCSSATVNHNNETTPL